MIPKLFFPNVLLKKPGFTPRYFSSPLLGNVEISCHLLDLEKIPDPTDFTHIHIGRRKTIPTKQKLFLGKFPCPSVCLFACWENLLLY